MAVGVYVACEDPILSDAITHAVSVADDCYPAPSLDGADAVLAEPSLLPDHGDAALVVLAVHQSFDAAQFAVTRGAHGVAAWPADPAALARAIHDAVARRLPSARGRVVAVIAARGGAGATTVAAYLAAGCAQDALLLDMRGGPAGQALFATADEFVSLADAPGIVRDPSIRAIRSMASEHAAGAPCVFGGTQPPAVTPALISCARTTAPVVIVDGDAPDADLKILVCGADVGSIRAAAAVDATHVVLNFAARGRVRAKDARRALGRDDIVVVPADPRIARAADLGRLARRGPARRALMKLGESL